jgi:hypothetical protein
MNPQIIAISSKRSERSEDSGPSSSATCYFLSPPTLSSSSPALGPCSFRSRYAAALTRFNPPVTEYALHLQRMFGMSALQCRTNDSRSVGSRFADPRITPPGKSCCQLVMLRTRAIPPHENAESRKQAVNSSEGEAAGRWCWWWWWKVHPVPFHLTSQPSWPAFAAVLAETARGIRDPYGCSALAWYSTVLGLGIDYLAVFLPGLGGDLLTVQNSNSQILEVTVLYHPPYMPRCVCVCCMRILPYTASSCCLPSSVRGKLHYSVQYCTSYNGACASDLMGLHSMGSSHGMPFSTVRD